MNLHRILRYSVLVALLLIIPIAAHAAVIVSVGIAPPILPVYAQPICPGDGYIWVPGYWAYDDTDGYYWVPGTWVLAPYTGALWTPGYWGWGDGFYLWHPGYWGLHIGYYGGINYGFGYFGHGFEGGYWNHGSFFVNRSFNHIDAGRVHNFYEHNVVVNNNSRVAFNGPHGINDQPRPEERIAEHEQHVGTFTNQQDHIRAANTTTAQFAHNNNGLPAVAATPRPGRTSFQQAYQHPDNPQSVRSPQPFDRQPSRGSSPPPQSSGSGRSSSGNSGTPGNSGGYHRH
jgi:hypothetical protein